MASRLLKSPPNGAQSSAVHRPIARQESVIIHLREMKEEDEREYKHLTTKVAMLKRTADSTNTFRNIGTRIRDQLSPILIQLGQLLSSQEADYAGLSSLLPSTKTLLTNWTAVKDALATLLSTLEEPMKKTKECDISTADELHNTEALQDQLSASITTFSEMIRCGLQGIKSKKEILHPLRRLPGEIMLQIFAECIEEERESLREMLPLVETPRVPSNLAAVCKRWRQIVLHTPHFWNYICTPPSSWNLSRVERYLETLSLACGPSIEMTLRFRGQLGHKAYDRQWPHFHRLNITNAAEIWPPPIPSPDHLWIGHSDSNHLSLVMPAAMISSTVRLTCLNVLPYFLQENQTIKVVSIRGAHFGPFFGSMMRNLSQLQEVDMTQLRLGALTTTFRRRITHYLSYLAIHASALPMIDFYLMRGLRLPALRRFAVEDIEHDTHSASRYRSIVPQFERTVTVLEISGTPRPDPILSWIERLLSLEGLVTHGEEATLVILGLLYQTSDSEADSQGAIRLPPKGLRKLVIREYIHEGTSILQHLKDIRRNPHPKSQPIEITFERCPNILPSIHAELSREVEKFSQPEITVGPACSDSQ